LKGAYASRKTRTATEFIVAERRLTLFFCTATIIATWFGGGTMMGVSGAAYRMFGIANLRQLSLTLVT